MGNATPADLQLREQVVAACRELTRIGLTPGTSGNVSVRRDASSFLISPSGMRYETLAPEDVPLLADTGRWSGRCRPSSEWRFHRDIFRRRQEAGAIVHTHSRYATALACTGRGIPAFHYMVAAAGGNDIRCAPYHTFGSQELSDAAVDALQARRACLLANHGVIALGSTLAAAMTLAAEVENLAAQYCAVLGLGDVRLLDATQMQAVLEKFRSYGRQDAEDADLVFAGTDLDDVQRQA